MPTKLHQMNSETLFRTRNNGLSFNKIRDIGVRLAREEATIAPLRCNVMFGVLTGCDLYCHVY
jgi:hypothetical protein